MARKHPGTGPKKTLYIVVHKEIRPWGDEYVVDEMVFHVTSSLDKAVAYIKSRWVAAYSWWEIQTTTLDSDDWPERHDWYGRRGAKLKSEPYKKALAAYKKYQAERAIRRDA